MGDDDVNRIPVIIRYLVVFNACETHAMLKYNSHTPAIQGTC